MSQTEAAATVGHSKTWLCGVEAGQNTAPVRILGALIEVLRARVEEQRARERLSGERAEGTMK
jgi:hypothetical protein